ncbi:MAG: tyrosine-type recombinase/integrase [Pseudobdellovibrio sp.]
MRAYRLDLYQAFILSLNDYKTSKENKNLIILNKDTPLIFNSSEDLWLKCRDRLSHWGKLSLATRNRKIATLKSFFNWLYNEKLIDKNFSNQLVCPKVPKKIPHFISVDEVISILHFFKNLEIITYEINQQKILFLLLYGGGLRISEACNLRWKDINIYANNVLILGKGNKERLITLPTLCTENLVAFQKLYPQKGDFIFGEKPLNTRKGYEYIRLLGKQVNLMNPLHPHSLRHSFATHMLASGTNLRVLQNLLGHDSLQATEKYTHLDIQTLARTVEIKHPLSRKKFTD